MLVPDSEVLEPYLHDFLLLEDVPAVEDVAGLVHALVVGGVVLGYELVPFGEYDDGVGVLDAIAYGFHLDQLVLELILPESLVFELLDELLSTDHRVVDLENSTLF